MSHPQILVRKLTILSDFSPGGWKKLIFGEIEGLTILSVLSKNGYQISLLPETTDVWSGQKWTSVATKIKIDSEKSNSQHVAGQGRSDDLVGTIFQFPGFRFLA